MNKELKKQIENEVFRVTMEQAREREDEIKERYGLTKLTKEEIKGVAEFINYCKKPLEEEIRELKYSIDNMNEIIDKLSGFKEGEN